MDKSKTLDFSGTTIYCGVDVHKKSWRVNIQDHEFEMEDFTQNPDTVLLHKHLTSATQQKFNSTSLFGRKKVMK